MCLLLAQLEIGFFSSFSAAAVYSTNETNKAGLKQSIIFRCLCRLLCSFVAQATDVSTPVSPLKLSRSKLAARSMRLRIRASLLELGEDLELGSNVSPTENAIESTSSAETDSTICSHFSLSRSSSRLLALALLIRLNLTSLGLVTARWLDITWKNVI